MCTRKVFQIAVMNGAGKIVMECVIETKASMILQFIDGLRGEVQVTFEEGTSAAWLYDLLKPQVTKLVVCDPRKNASMREGNQSDKIDARRLAELLRLNHLNPVYHGEHGLRSLKELVRSYLTITKDLARVMSRVKAIYRSWAIPYDYYLSGRIRRSILPLFYVVAPLAQSIQVLVMFDFQPRRRVYDVLDSNQPPLITAQIVKSFG
jgi:transposase